MTTLDISSPRAKLRAEWFASRQADVWIYGLLLALAVAPVFWWPIPRGADLVDHWARLTLYHQTPGDPVANLYRVHFGLIPNMGVDLVYLALWPWASALTAMKIATALAIVLPALGAFAIHSALFDKPSPTIWIVPFFSYNVVTTVGLINFALGAGLTLIAIAYALNRPQGLKARDLFALNAFGAALFFCHLIALAMYLVLLAGVLAMPLRAAPRELIRRAIVALLAIVVPTILLLLREHSPSNYIIKDFVGISFMLLPIETMTGWDSVFMFMLAGLLALAVIPGVRVAPRAWLALPAYALLCFTVPRYSGAATLIDSRLKVYLWYFAFAVTTIKTQDMRERMRPAIAAAVLVALAFRIWAMAPAWDEFNRYAIEMRAFLKPLPLGSRVLVVDHHDCDNYKMGIVTNLTTFAVIDRRSFINTLFAQTGMQPVAPTDPLLDGGPTITMDTRWLDPAEQEFLPPVVLQTEWGQAFKNWRQHFTHIIDAHAVCPATLTTPGLTKISAMPGFDLYRID